MKRFITSIVALAATFTLSFGQGIPNGGFEDWTSSGTYEEPDGWTTGNLFTFFSDSIPVTVEKTTDSHSGTFAAKLTSKAVNADLDEIVGLSYDTMPGLLALGSFASGQLGAPYNSSPEAAEVYVKYTQVGSDTAGILFSLTRWDQATESQIIVAQAAALLASSTNNYQQVTLPFNYFQSGSPDSVNVLILSSVTDLLGNVDVTPSAGSTLFVDDASLITELPNSVVENPVDFRIFPNPTSGTLNMIAFGYMFNGALTLDIVDMTGRVVQSSAINTVMSTTDVSSLPNGLYVYRINDSKGLLKSGKFTVAK